MMADHSELGRKRSTGMIASIAMCIGLLVGVGQTPAAAGHYVFIDVQGSAFGFFSNVSLSGAPAETGGPDPMVALTGDGSAVPITASAPTGSAQYGAATLFSSGRLHVSTVGLAGDRITGDTGSDVTSTATVQDVSGSGTEVLTASSLTSTCTVGLFGNSSRTTELGIIGDTSIFGGTLRISEGDPAVEGDETTVALPIFPHPNMIYEGQMGGTGESFRYVFNEQILNADGSFTVNAAHMYLLGPTATGELIVGQSVCGVRKDSTIRSHPFANPDAYSTDFETVLNVAAPGVLANDIQDPFGDHENRQIGQLTAEIRTQPANGSMVLNPDGSFIYSPNAGFSGVDTFKYMVSDATGGEEATVSITVGDAPPPATVTSIAVTPTEVTISDGATQQFIATGTYSDGSTADVTASVTWSSSNTGVATITSAGLATGEAAGSTTISATNGSTVGSTNLTISPATLTSIDVTPADPRIPNGRTIQFTTMARYSDGTTADVTTLATWSSSSSTVASIDATGLARARARGQTSIGATYMGVTGSTTLSVEARPRSGGPRGR